MKDAKARLDDRQWKEFFLEDVVSIGNGKRLTKNDMLSGSMPFIGASEMNNGVTAFTSSTNESLDSNVLGVNYNGSVGFSFYHPYPAIFSDDVKRVKWKDGDRNNKYTLLFLSAMIDKQKCKFAYGYKFNSQRMKRQKILLPVASGNMIDYAFMEAYMRQKEQEILEPTIHKLCKRLIINHIIGGVKVYILVGKHFISQKFLQKYSVESVLKRQTTLQEQYLMCRQQPLTMVWTNLSVMKAA